MAANLRDFWRQKTNPWLSYGVVCVIVGFAVLVKHKLVTSDRQTDGWTDRQAHDDSIYRASIASSGKNVADIWSFFKMEAMRHLIFKNSKF